jgi:hypothetical protein
LRAGDAEKVILGAQGMLFPSGKNSLYFRAMNQPKIFLFTQEQREHPEEQNQESSVTLPSRGKQFGESETERNNA